MAGFPRFHTETPTLVEAVAAYWGGRAERDLPPSTQRAYRHAHQALLEAVGGDQPITVLSDDVLRRVLERRWADAPPATWNARVSAVRSLVAYGRRHGWLTDGPTTLERRPLGDETNGIPYDDLTALWSRPDISLREKTLWHMLYDTAARADEILALDVDDLDLPHRRAIISGKGGHRQTILWGTDTAGCLARYLAERRRGPVFLTHRQAKVVRTDPDRHPATGPARLSCWRARAIFHELSGGWTLHQLRQSAATNQPGKPGG